MEVVERLGHVMASELRVVVVDPRAGQVDDALAELDRLERQWSRFLPESDISRINRAGGTDLVVDASTLTLLATMVRAVADTGGRFDPSVLPVLVGLGYGPCWHDASPRPTPANLLDRPTWLELRLDPATNTVAVPPGLAVDPGGIGKGLAADLAVRRLLSHGAAGALVSIGGDLAMAGAAPDAQGWSVTIERPSATAVPVGTVSVDAGGVATSSTTSRRWPHDGRDVHHIIDPRTRAMSATTLAAVTVIAVTGWEAEAHATAALLEGRDGAVSYLDAHGLDGVAVDGDGTIHTTSRLGFLRAARAAEGR